MSYKNIHYCSSCGTEWSGYGTTCNACKTIEAIKKQNTGSTPEYSGGGGDGRGLWESFWEGMKDDPIFTLAMTTALVTPAVFFDYYFLNSFFVGILWWLFTFFLGAIGDVLYSIFFSWWL